MPIVKGSKLNSNPKVSAVIAAYNEEIHLPACIESLLKQSYKKIEIIVVENGESKDKTFQIAKEYEKKYPKKIFALSISGKQKGPGNAWNFGIRKAKGEIILIVGADLRYGKEYIRKGIKPIINGDTVAIMHTEEKCDNAKNLWARAFFYKRSSILKPGLSRIFSLIRKDYIRKHPFNPEEGYGDDQTIYLQQGAEFPVFNLEVYHTNPATFADTWSHSLWVGRSIKNSWLIILILPIFPFYSLYKTIKHLRIDPYSPFIFFLPFYYSIRYFAYLLEAFKSF